MRLIDWITANSWDTRDCCMFSDRYMLEDTIEWVDGSTVAIQYPFWSRHFTAGCERSAVSSSRPNRKNLRSWHLDLGPASQRLALLKKIDYLIFDKTLEHVSVARWSKDETPLPLLILAKGLCVARDYTSVNSRTVRKSMLVRLSRDLGRMQFPYFMPVDKSLPSPPIIFE